MQEVLSKLFFCFIIISMIGCVTVRDVQRGTDIIRIDNDLERTLKSVPLDDEISRLAELTQIGDYAKKEGDTLKKQSDKTLDALAYYRIAATAYWKSKNPNVTDNLFATVNNGIEICNTLGRNAPDRDCFYLQLVIPFAGLESITSEKSINNLLDKVNFSDGTATLAEIAIMNEAAAYLGQVKPQVESILAIGKDDRMLSHLDMTAYYCGKAKKAMRFFDTRAAGYTKKAILFENAFSNNDPPLQMPLEKVQDFRKLQNELPALCSQ